MTSSWQAVLIKCRYEPRIIPILLAILRLLICFMPQPGYLHPDEFFQSPEVVAKQYFGSNVNLVWEFKTDKPIRCMLIPTLLNSIAFKIITLISRNPSAYLLLTVPRFVYTLLSFIIDLSLYKLCRYYSSRGLWYLPVSVIFQTSFVCLACLTRTFSNTVEVVIFALLLVVVCRTIRPRFRILFVTPNRRTPVSERVKGSTQLTSSILLGLLIALGIFNRPTFPCFALVPSIYWVLESYKRNSNNFSLTIQRALIPLTISAILTAIVISAFDTAYYNDFQVLKDLFRLLIEFKYDEFFNKLKSDWVLTPYNFISYNTSITNLASYGLHLPYTHMLVNMPLAFNVLSLLFYGKLLSLLIGSGVYRLVFSTHRVYSLMLLSTLTATILLSFIPHQEFRFLLPLIVPLVYAFSFKIYVSNKWLTSWILVNVILILFYNNIHQAGVIQASLDLDPLLKSHAIKSSRNDNRQTHINVMALRCYLVPSYLWNIGANDERFNFDLQETFNDFNSSLSVKLGHVISKQQELADQFHESFIMLPQLYEQQLENYLSNHHEIESHRLELVKRYSPHFGGEDLQLSLDHLKTNGLWQWRKAFGFSLLKLNLVNKLNND